MVFIIITIDEEPVYVAFSKAQSSPLGALWLSRVSCALMGSAKLNRAGELQHPE